MNVSFVNTTSNKLSSLSIVNGQLVALSDKAGLYYDLGGVRRQLNPQGNASTYGLVKVSDNYTSSAGTASSGIAASSYALNQVYTATAKKLDKGWILVGQVSGTSSSLTIPKATLDSTSDVIALIKIPLGTSMTGRVYYTSILKVTDIVFGGFYYDSKYYACVALNTVLNSNGSFSLSI